MNNPLDDLLGLFERGSSTFNGAVRDVRFSEWFSKLQKGAPVLQETIRLTPENFRKALRQAFRAGWDANRKP